MSVSHVYIHNVEVPAGLIDTIDINITDASVPVGFSRDATLINFGDLEVGSEDEDAEFLYSNSFELKMRFDDVSTLNLVISAMQGSAYAAGYDERVKLHIDSDILKVDYLLDHNGVTFDIDTCVLSLKFKDQLTKSKRSLEAGTINDYQPIDKIISHLIYNDFDAVSIEKLTQIRAPYIIAPNNYAEGYASLINDFKLSPYLFNYSNAFTKPFSSANDSLKALLNSLCSSLIIDRFGNHLLLPKYRGYFPNGVKTITQKNIEENSFEPEYRPPLYNAMNMQFPTYSDDYGVYGQNRRYIDLKYQDQKKGNVFNTTVGFQMGYIPDLTNHDYPNGQTVFNHWAHYQDVANSYPAMNSAELYFHVPGSSPEWGQAFSMSKHFLYDVYMDLMISKLKFKVNLFGLDYGFDYYYQTPYFPGKLFRLLYAKYQFVKNMTSVVCVQI